MVAAVSLDAPAPEGDNPKAIRLYAELKLTQVKTLVFLVILSRSQTAKPMVEPHQEAICSALVTIMKTAPSNGSLALRKEILNAFRTILTSDELNRGLVLKVEELLDMDVLIGTDRAVSESLKQVAFIHVTELLLLVKQDIKVEFIQRVVDMAIDSLMDAAAPLTLHVTSVRVLYNIVVDNVFPRRAESEQFRDILACLRLQLALQDVVMTGQVGLCSGLLEHVLFAFQYLETHIRTTQVAAHHEQVVFLRTIAVHDPVLGCCSNCGDADDQAACAAAGIPSHQVNAVLVTCEQNT